MLYVTTANKYDAFTAHNTLCRDCTKEGGLFIPYQMPKLSAEQVDSLKDKTFGQRIADILNLFFSARLNGWDVDFCIGRSPAKLVTMSNRVLIAETWHNLEWDFAEMVRNLSNLLLGKGYTGGNPTGWTWIAVRIAALFGIFGELEKLGLADSGGRIDLAVAAGDFSAPFAAWYAREMGLPVGTIIISCTEDSGVWDLLHHGQMRTDNASVPKNLERLIFAAAGFEAVQSFQCVCGSGKVYIPEKEVFKKLSRGMFAAVVSHKRIASVIYNVHKTGNYILETDSAMAYGGLQDYLARSRETSPVLILAEKNPICSSAAVADALGISIQELKNRLDVT